MQLLDEAAGCGLAIQLASFLGSSKFPARSGRHSPRLDSVGRTLRWREIYTQTLVAALQSPRYNLRAFHRLFALSYVPGHSQEIPAHLWCSKRLLPAMSASGTFRAVDLIRKQRDGAELSAEEIAYFVRASTTGETLDKLESIPGFNVNLPVTEFRRVLEKCGCSMIGQTAQIAPADRKFYALRDVTGTVESPYLICASIMSKKLAEGIDGLVLDVKTGSGAFMKKEEDAAFLASLMAETGQRMGKKVVALITDMNQPLGKMAGNSVEVIECVEVLRGEGPSDLRELCLQLC